MYCSIQRLKHRKHIDVCVCEATPLGSSCRDWQIVVPFNNLSLTKHFLEVMCHQKDSVMLSMALSHYILLF